MNELQAIMGLCNLKHIEQVIAARKELSLLQGTFAGGQRNPLFDANKDASKNYAYFPVLIEEEYSVSRDALYKLLRENNIYARKYFYPITADMECYAEQYAQKGLITARKLAKQVLTIPLYEQLKQEQMNRILELIC